MGGEDTQNLLVDLMLDFSNKKKHKFKRTSFQSSSFEYGLNKFQFETIQFVTTYETSCYFT
jgi:hypothetical protein